MLAWFGWLLALMLGGVAALLAVRLLRIEERYRPQIQLLQQCSAELERCRSLLQCTLESLQDAVLLVNAEGSIVSANPAAERMLGQNLKQKTLLQSTLSYDLNLLLSRCVQTQRPQHAELKFGHPQSRTVQVHITPLPTASHAAEATYLVVLTDLSELRRLEQIRSDFVANVSHELRTPLASIRANAEALLEVPPDDVSLQQRFLNTIVQQVERLTRITEDLLILAQAEARPVPISQAVSLAPLVESLVEQLKPQAEKASVTIISQVPPDFVVCAQRDHLEQILWNLMDNAIKYNRPGGRVTVTASRTPEGSEVIVEDTGIGIPHEHLPRIFERFYRVDKARSRTKGGTGLGLSIVKHLVESHGGKVWVESEWNVGSRFGILLPDSYVQESCAS